MTDIRMIKRSRLEFIQLHPTEAEPWEISNLAAYATDAFESAAALNTVHEGDHCECADHLRAIVQRMLRTVPVVEKEARVLRGAITEIIHLCTSCVAVTALPETHELAESAVRRALSGQRLSNRNAPQWCRHEWEQKLYHDVMGLDVPMVTVEDLVEKPDD